MKYRPISIIWNSDTHTGTKFVKTKFELNLSFAKLFLCFVCDHKDSRENNNLQRKWRKKSYGIVLDIMHDVLEGTILFSCSVGILLS